MEYVKIEGQFPKFSHCAVTLGKFDGIHRGHRKLIQTILNRKKEYGELAVVMAFVSDRQTILTSEERRILLEKMGVDYLQADTGCALPGFVDSKNEEKTERNAGYLVVSHSGGGMLRQGTRKGIRRTPANRGMRAHWVVKGLDISEDVCHGMCP